MPGDEAILTDLVRACVDASPDAVAIESFNGTSTTSLTRREVWERASRVAQVLRAAGVGEAQKSSSIAVYEG
jgi:acyl-CoA synthetase (AMP-forming)/AMP-acid ligase II